MGFQEVQDLGFLSNSRGGLIECSMRKILVIYFCVQYPLVSSISDHLYSFERYSGGRCYYLNLAFKRFPRYLAKVDFDLIIFHTIFLATRWTRSIFDRVMRRVEILKEHPAVKVALPQDEFYCSEALCNFINDFGISHVFSAAPRSEWAKIYKGVDFGEVNFHRVLTGYLEEDTINRIEKLEQRSLGRNIDIGYRAWHAEPWLGRHGILKTKIAEVFEKVGSMKGLTTDISTRFEDRYSGDDWFKFLLNCKWTIGVEGGASLLDWDGSIRQETDNYVAEHPEATFEQVENACFPKLDGNLELYVISPRHLEACATRTCQILLEGDYSGILTAGEDYIELKRDFRNLDEVLEVIGNDALREEIVEKAYRKVVSSGRLIYRLFVQSVLKSSLNGIVERDVSSSGRVREWLIWRWTRICEGLSWAKALIYWKFRAMTIKLFPLLPNSLRIIIERWKERYLF